MELRSNQFELDGLVFGANVPIDVEEFTPGSYGTRSQDTSSPIGDGNSFGRDYFEPDAWSFKLFTNVEDEVEALALRSQIAQVWRGDDVRTRPGAVLPLRYSLGGRTRIVYGRPRRFDAPIDTRMYGGFIAITCDFKLASELTFDDAERSVSIRATAPTIGGFSFPVTFPLITEATLATRPNSFIVDTEQPTPMLVDFTGPSTDAFLEIDGVRVIQLTGDIPPGITLTVDARPWVMSVYRSDGSGVGGMLSRRTRLPRLLLTPGPHQATYGGYDPTGASSAAVRWRKAYPSL